MNSKYYELEFSQGMHPDNIVIVEANCMATALDRYQELVAEGKINRKGGDIVFCRLIYYVYDKEFGK